MTDKNLANKILHYYKQYMYFIGYIGQFFYLIQSHKIWVTKSASDVSFLGVLISFVAVASWALYGYVIQDKLILKTYLFGTAAGLLCLIMILLYS